MDGNLIQGVGIFNPIMNTITPFGPGPGGMAP